MFSIKESMQTQYKNKNNINNNFFFFRKETKKSNYKILNMKLMNRMSNIY